MRRGTFFEYAHDSAHWVEPRGVKYQPGWAGRLNDPTISTRVQTSSRPWGVAMNVPSPQRFGHPIMANAAHRVTPRESASFAYKWKRRQ
jgi:hypothetical protein